MAHTYFRFGFSLSLLLVLSACPPPSSGVDSGFDAGDGGDGMDAGPADAGPPPPCTFDDECSSREPGSRCEPSTGKCVAAKPCANNGECNDQQVNDYCTDSIAEPCRCVVEANDGGKAGVCRRRKPSCAECETDSECGSDQGVFDPVGACRAIDGDDGGKKFCLRAPDVGTCSCGYVSQGGFCAPASKSCGAPGCVADADCKNNQVCNTQSCICENRCRWDFAEKKEAGTGCPAGKICWVDNASLNPNSIYYGSGRCRAPCSMDAECTNTATNPNGGAKLKCAAETLVDGGSSLKRCRANGACMDTLECPRAADTATYLGYCDRGTFACVADKCRVGDDPLTAQPFKDCRAPHACAVDAGVNYCRLLSCAEQGGAAIACDNGEYCCGEDKDGDGNADPCPSVSMKPDKCYPMPKPPFCTACMTAADCNAAVPSFGCTNGSKSPSCSPLPMLCVYAGDRGPGVMGINVCAPSTWNDGTQDPKFKVGKSVRGCPSGVLPSLIRPVFAMDGENYCVVDNDCRKGNSTGICGPDLQITLQDGGHPKSCQCFAGPGGDAMCPNLPDAGITSVCAWNSVDGGQMPCVTSVVCQQKANKVYSPTAAGFGACGL